MLPLYLWKLATLWVYQYKCRHWTEGSDYFSFIQHSLGYIQNTPSSCQQYSTRKMFAIWRKFRGGYRDCESWSSCLASRGWSCCVWSAQNWEGFGGTYHQPFRTEEEVTEKMETGNMFRWMAGEWKAKVINWSRGGCRGKNPCEGNYSLDEVGWRGSSLGGLQDVTGQGSEQPALQWAGTWPRDLLKFFQP